MAESIPSLVDYWSEVMPEAERAVLLEVLSDRRYRIKSLPPAPDGSDILEASVAKSEQPATAQEKIESRIRAGLISTFILGLFFVGASIYQYIHGQEVMQGQDLERTGRILAFLVGEKTLIALGFFALFFWARSEAKPALSLSFSLWFLFACLPLLMKGKVPGALLILCGIGLMVGLRGAFQASKLKRAAKEVPVDPEVP